MKSQLKVALLAVVFLAPLAAACSDSAPSIPGPSPAGKAGPLTKGPCPYDAIDPGRFGNEDFENPVDERFTDGTKTLTVKYSDANTMVGGCQVNLRSYNGQLVGPTIRAKPGETVAFTLKNELPPGDPARDIAQEEANAHLIMTPNSFNTTNIHYHGLHVTPQPGGDDVLLAIEPGQDFPYKFEVPADHPAGTFWYHAHAHGSSSIQVGSGMVGALIIEDDLAKLPASLREATAARRSSSSNRSSTTPMVWSTTSRPPSPTATKPRSTASRASTPAHGSSPTGEPS